MASRRRRRSASDLDEALAVVDRTYGSPEADRIPRVPGVTRFGKILLFTPHERVQLRAVRDLIERYLARANPPRPLSLAVFGPPGSGKSTAVKQILNSVETTARVMVSQTEVNLTQVPGAEALGKVIAHAGRPVDGTVPAFFFDEFDAPRAGAPYGWLSWFLAPMHDGQFVYDGNIIPLRRAVYVFAGGTAATLEEFSSFERHPEFRRAKGPVSGLSSPRGAFMSIILDNGVLTEACEPQSSDQPFVFALGRLTVDEQPEALLEGQRGDVGLSRSDRRQ